MYLLRSIQNVNKTATILLLLLQFPSCIQLTEQQLPSYKLHQKQLKIGKKPKTKTRKPTVPIFN